jgi:ferredoxin
MSENAVFYFSGTGNSLRVARLIAEELGDCEQHPIASAPVLGGNYERIGFVFPHYALGVPNMVRKWLEVLDISENRNAYFFAVETYGAYKGNCLAQVKNILRGKGISLDYGDGVKMFANNIANYKMANNAKEQAVGADISARKIALRIRQKETNDIGKSNPLFAFVYKKIVASYPSKGQNFNVSSACVGCMQCAQICPTGNIDIQQGRPIFGSRCEWCMACIQWCPKAAINYKTKTRDRNRYHHPCISCQDMIVR